MINRKKTKRIRLLGEADVSVLKDRVKKLPEKVWSEHNATKPNKFGVLDKTEHIVFRFINDFKDHTNYDNLPAWEAWKNDILPLLETAKSYFGYKQAEYPRIMLAKLPASESVKPHIDRSPAAEFPHKIHIPILTNDKAEFSVANESIYMLQGSIYEVNNQVIHSAKNKGNTERIHLIFELFEMI